MNKGIGCTGVNRSETGKSLLGTGSISKAQQPFSI